ncbi:O-antigen polymerase [Pseudoalteromonas spongiae]|uniref:O-antigen polymerase n=1 Tax=Pseudoalteromonas spongiae TaxID=298657 RepID=UPI003735859F
MENSKSTITVLALLYFFLLGAVQYFYVGTLFGYFQFKSEFSLFNLALSIFSILCVYVLLNPRGLAIAYSQVLYVLILIPSLVLFTFGGASIEFFFITFLSTLIVAFFVTYMKPPVVTGYQFNTDTLLLIFIAISVLYLLSIVAQGGLSYLNFNLSKVYDYRGAAADNLPSFYKYLSPLVGKVLVPLIIVMSVIKRKIFYMLIGVGCSVMIFGLTSHKAPVIYPILVLALYYMPWRNLPIYMLSGVIFICIVSFWDFYMMANSSSPYFGWFGSILSRRALLIPAHLNSMYIEFFSQNPVYLWSESKFSFGLSEMPYKLPSVFMIGYNFYGDMEISANTGWIGSGFANFRIYGVIIYSVILGSILAYFSALGDRIGQKFVFGATFVVVITLFSSTDLTTALLTHGLLALLFIMLFFRENAMSGNV